MRKWLALASLALTIILGWVVWDASQQEWKGFQKSYYQLALLNAQGRAQEEWARGQRLEIKQIEVKELRKTERCGTCHLGVDNPQFQQAPEPFRQHSSLLESHPPQRFGCTVCHAGEGRAVSTLEAHGEGGDLSRRLLKGEYLQAACYNCHGEETLPPQAIAAVVRGRQLVNRSLCLGCHQIKGEGGNEGPDLSTVGSRRYWLWLYAHLANPQAVVVGSTMPVFPLTREEIKDITIYLMTLLDSKDQLRDSSLGAKKVAVSYAPEKAEEGVGFPGAELVKGFPYNGKALFQGAGCSLCHTVGSKGGEVGPALTHISRKRGAEELERLLKGPDQFLPGGKMPYLDLNERQIKALVAYLSTLK